MYSHFKNLQLQIYNRKIYIMIIRKVLKVIKIIITMIIKIMMIIQIVVGRF